jgi:protein involved in temperature-dependent protein secretion
VSLKSLEDVVRKQPASLDARFTLVRALVARGEISRTQAEGLTLAKDVPRSAVE